MNTTENNKLIVEFMGGLFNKHSNKYGIGNAEFITIGKLNNVVKAINHYDIVDLKYHSDWNWLMQVVEKIETIENYRFDVEIRQSVVVIFDKDEQQDILEVDSDTNIDAVYTACVEFVKWYNEQK